MLWEALAGRHPFWRGSMLETARAIESGARPLGELRPDLPKRLLRLVDRTLAKIPARRPSARELADELRGAASSASVPRARHPLSFPHRAGRRALTAVLAAVLAGWTSSALPVLPARLAARAGVRRRRGDARPRARRHRARARGADATARQHLARARAPLHGTRRGWLLVTWREPRATLLFVVGPLLAPIAALGLLPLAAMRVRSGAAARPRRSDRRADRRTRRRNRPRDAAARRRACAARNRHRRRGATRSTSPARSPTPPPRTRRSCSRPVRSRSSRVALPHAGLGGAGRQPGSARG